MARYFDVVDVYSSYDVGKVVCFKSIIKRFGINDYIEYVAIGDSQEEFIAAKKVRMYICLLKLI